MWYSMYVCCSNFQLFKSFLCVMNSRLTTHSDIFSTKNTIYSDTDVSPSLLSSKNVGMTRSCPWCTFPSSNSSWWARANTLWVDYCRRGDSIHGGNVGNNVGNLSEMSETIYHFPFCVEAWMVPSSETWDFSVRHSVWTLYLWIIDLPVLDFDSKPQRGLKAMILIPLNKSP
jgi:hypothetical protein